MHNITTSIFTGLTVGIIVVLFILTDKIHDINTNFNANVKEIIATEGVLPNELQALEDRVNRSISDVKADTLKATHAAQQVQDSVEYIAETISEKEIIQDILSQGRFTITETKEIPGNVEYTIYVLDKKTNKTFVYNCQSAYNYTSCKRHALESAIELSK